MSCPAPFPDQPGRVRVLPDLSQIRSDHRSWFNQRGARIIESTYNMSTGEQTAQMYPWNVPATMSTVDLWPCAKYQTANPFWELPHTQPCDLNRCCELRYTRP
jgi:hypothetical protein